MMRRFLSLSPEQAASFSLNSSSLIPTQFKASASAPVTCPTLAVSLADSIGRASPNVPQTPAAIFVHLVMSCSFSASCASSCEASAAVSVSPKIL